MYITRSLYLSFFTLYFIHDYNTMNINKTHLIRCPDNKL